MVGEAGLEPTTPGLEGRCSIQLSYSPVSAIVSSTAPLEATPRNIHDRGQGEIERPDPGLIGALRSCAAALDEPGHSKTRNSVNLRAPQDKFHPRRARRNRAQPFGHRPQPPLLGVEALDGSPNRGLASRYTSRRQKLSLRARHPSRRDRMDHRHARGCCSTHRTWRSRDAK